MVLCGFGLERGFELDLLLGAVHARVELAAAFALGVQLEPEQQCDVGDPQPDQQADEASERSVGLVVGAEVRDVERERAEAISHTTIASSAPGVTTLKPGSFTFGAA